jgi:mevalonate kinase
LGDVVAATPEALVAGAEADEGAGAATLAALVVAVAGGVAALGGVDTDNCAHPQRLAAARATAV